jgi:uncharacterized protein (TIGR00290 family)
MRRVILSWSSGKDSAHTLHILRQRPDIEVVALLTSFNSAFDRVAMHAVRRQLVEAQAERARLPLWSVDLPWPCSNEQYEPLMSVIWPRATTEGVTEIAFGDLFLADVRGYRERQLAATGLKPLFPLWQLPTPTLAQQMIDSGIRAKITCVDPTKLDRSFAGRDFDQSFVKSLPASADPCGENGEFHTFVHAAPVFSQPIPIQVGPTVERDGFLFSDILPATPAGLCSACAHSKTVVSDRGSIFNRCLLAQSNPRFRKYPHIPVLACPGFESAA